jgi:MFS family permease
MQRAECDPRRWFQLGLLGAVELLAMSLWFSASAVAPALREHWSLSSGQTTWLTISVQLGFVVGSLLSAIFNLPEVLSAPRLIAVSAVAAALFNVAIPLGISDELGRLQSGFALAIGMRFLTGAALAGVYPPGMKVAASWFLHGRGLAIGILVGALTIGSATPHLINAFPVGTLGPNVFRGLSVWRMVMIVASSAAAIAAFLAVTGIRLGPHLPVSKRFDWT